MKNEKVLNRLIFALSLLGLSVTSFLLYEYSLSGPVICPIGGSGCDIVRASPYSHIFGIPIPILGVAFYLPMAVSAVMYSQRLFFNKKLINLRILASLFAVGYGSYLTYLEAFVIKAYCFWCVVSFIISIVILAVIILSLRKVPDDQRN